MRKGLRFLVITLCVLAVALTAAPLAAAGPSTRVQGQSQHARGFGHFKDLSSGHWAYRDITMMQVKKVFGGYGDGRFGAQDPVTRIQLVCLALRIMGQEDEAQAMGFEAATAYLGGVFSDAEDLPTWAGARECLAYAHENGFLFGLTYQEQEAFRAGEPATRLEVVVTLLEAMGHHDEAAGLTGAVIEAPDADTVPDWAHGYVALAIEMGLLRGDQKGNLNLHAHVTRAEMATLLSRADDKVESPADHRVITGVVVSVVTGAEASITIETEAKELDEYEDDEDEDDDEDEPDEDEGDDEDEAEPDEDEPDEVGAEEDEGDDEDECDGTDGTVVVTYPVSPDVLVFLRGTLTSLESIAAGDKVHLRLVGGIVVVIDAKVEQEEISGYMISGTYEGETLTSVTIAVGAKDSDDEDEDEDEDEEDEDELEGDDEGEVVPEGEATFAVSPDAVVWFRGDKNSDVEPQPGDYLELKLVHDQVIIIVIDERFEIKGEITGILVAVDDVSITLTVVEVEWEEAANPDIVPGTDVTLTLASDVDCKWKGDEVAPVLVPIGVTLMAKLEGDLVTKIRVKDCDQEGETEVELEGVLVSADATSLTLTITEVDDDDESSEYVVGAEVTLTLASGVRVKGLGRHLGLSDLPAGTELEVTIKDGLVTEVSVEGDDDDDDDDDDDEEDDD